MIRLPNIVRLPALCHALQMDYWTLMAQPASFIYGYQVYLEGRNRAEAAKMKEKKPVKRPHIRQPIIHHK